MKKIASMLVIFLAACGGGEASYDQVQFGPIKDPSVLTIGDSTTTPVYEGERSAPDILANLTGWHVTNIGVSGTTACQADLAAIRAARATVVTANYAINDSAFETLPHDRECWGAIASAAKDAGSVLVIIESSPIYPGGAVSWMRDDATRLKFEEQKRRIATYVGAYYCSLSLPWSLDMLPDGVHPGAKSKPLIAARYAECIKAALN